MDEQQGNGNLGKFNLKSFLSIFSTSSRLHSSTSLAPSICALQREKLASLTAVVQEQRSQLELQSHHSILENHDEEVLFYSIRSITTGDQDIPPLKGKRLNATVIMDPGEAHTARKGIEGDDGDVYSEVLLGQLNMIEDGEARGWACRRASRGGSLTNAVVAVYVDDVLVAEAVADEALDLPIAVLEMCQDVPEEDESPSRALPIGFSAKLPMLREGQHNVSSMFFCSLEVQETSQWPRTS